MTWREELHPRDARGRFTFKRAYLAAGGKTAVHAGEPLYPCVPE